MMYPPEGRKPRKPARWLAGEKESLARKIRSFVKKYEYLPTSSDIATAFGPFSDFRDTEQVHDVLTHHPDLFDNQNGGWDLTKKAHRMLRG